MTRIKTLLVCLLFNAAFGFSMLAQERQFLDQDLTGADLTGQDLMGWRFVNSTLDRAQINGVNATNAKFESDSTFRMANFANADLSDSVLASDFEQANLVDAQLVNARLTCESSFFGANLSNADLTEADICGTTLFGATLDNANISQADFRTGLPFDERLQMAMPLDELSATANYRNRDLQSVTFAGNLSGWDLSNQNLSNADLQTTNVTDAVFLNADISGATLPSTFTQQQLISTASFQNRDLAGVNVRGSLAGLDLSDFDLSGALLSGDLTNADFTNAELGGRIPSRLTEEQLMSTANYQRKELRDLDFSFQARDWNLQGMDLEGSFVVAPSDPANMAGASILGARLSDGPQEAFSQTASHQQKDLRDVVFPSVMYDWDLRGFNLTGAFIGQSRMRNVDLRGANLSNALMTAELEYDNVQTDAGTTYNQWTLFPGWSFSDFDRRRFDPDDFGMTYVETAEGDFDANGRIDNADLDDLQMAIRDEVHQRFGASWWERDRRFDLNNDRIVDKLDLGQLTAMLGTTLGDSNLDGMVDFSDFLKLSDNYGSDGTWADGDFDGDGRVGFPDFLLLSEQFGSEPLLIRNVPEPNFGLPIACIGLFLWKRRRTSTFARKNCVFRQ